MPSDTFWLNKRPVDFTQTQWESLCDGCGRCCLHKLKDAETGDIYYTTVACRYLDPFHCRCLEYDRRSLLAPHCLVLSPTNTSSLKWLPATCAYRLISLGEDLYPWHPLISKNRESVHSAGISVRCRTVPETMLDIAHWPDFIVDWQ